MTANEPILGNGIVKSSANPFGIFVDKNNNEYVCSVECLDTLDARLPFEDQACAECQDNPFDIGG